ncbi:tRNA uracil 4-sulfurtransferase ThiI [Scopulibacillus cellulosilyticus]|uniref:Probable tRNA sulfurtransferase n=1 Tax=Scopulibacillus cellulosilyticus TaxID=2665665 RepID=A0ABW2Q1X0_9BACL
MIYDYLIVRFGELTLKGKNRNKFIDRLYVTVKEKLKPFPQLKLKRHFDDIEIQLNNEPIQQVTDVLTKIFGIQTIRAAIKVENDLESIKQGALKIIKSEEANIKTFKISAKRKNKKFPTGSDELNRTLGGHILTNTEDIKVDVHQPDINLRVEVMEHETRIYGKDFKGAGGLPAGSSGKVLLMLSGGIDSPVAGYLMQKRGAVLEAIHFHSPPYTNERARQKVIDLTEKLNDFGGQVKLHIVPFTDIQIQIRDKMPDNYRMTMMRRMMLRIAEKLAEKRGALAIATGESLGQVASQTLESMNTINEVTNLPVLRPLLTMDKVEIIDIAHKINTYDISIRPYEDCCTLFLPSAPKTKPNREHANKFEIDFPINELIQEAIDGIETIDLREQNNKTSLMDELL